MCPLLFNLHLQSPMTRQYRYLASHTIPRWLKYGRRLASPLYGACRVNNNWCRWRNMIASTDEHDEAWERHARLSSTMAWLSRSRHVRQRGGHLTDWPTSAIYYSRVHDRRPNIRERDKETGLEDATHRLRRWTGWTFHSDTFYASANSSRPRALFLSCRPSVSCPLTPIYHCTQWRDFNETCYKQSSYERELLTEFTRSEVKGQGHSKTRCTLAAEAWGVEVHFNLSCDVRPVNSRTYCELKYNHHCHRYTTQTNW